MSYKVHLTYFRPTGKYLSRAVTVIELDTLEAIWAEIHELRRLGRLPGIRPNAGRDLFVIVDIPGHPERRPHLVRPPSLDEEDVTLVQVSLREIELPTDQDDPAQGRRQTP
jgi:hypothetical protein